jgi:hypothetical protein
LSISQSAALAAPAAGGAERALMPDELKPDVPVPAPASAELPRDSEAVTALV